ncbi:MAG: 2-amino-4-hydroxy-6-hydroxymethyldihydropteridine diphosphokinase [Planctomycetia bacterium]|nr:2-amino-4-hydroxy-6-hydroxymethyldihydropteridine diphosphokinase [Planctomycetia bacterium]
MSVTAFIALGSNLGDRHAYLLRALQLLRKNSRVRIERVSRFRETVPIGGPTGQGLYLNAAAQLQTDLAPAELLQLLLQVEQSLGRERLVPDGPRTLDLDLLLYGDRILREAALIVPHPRMHERRFVLGPLAEIAPLQVHPVLGQPVAQLLAQLPPETDFGRELAGARAVVTGSTSGIGRAIALELAAGGADVLIHGRRSPAAAESVAAACRQRGVQSRVLLADLRDSVQSQQLVASAWKDWGRVDVWVNNAGADTLTGEAAHWPFERKLEELLAVDVTATLTISREVGRRMTEAGGGLIVNLGWDQAETGMEGDSGQLFGATKAAVMAFTRSLAKTLAPVVRVNAVAPGWIRTAWGAGASAAWQERVLRETPLARWGLPEDVAQAVRWLAAPAATYVTGQILRVNGGAVC